MVARLKKRAEFVNAAKGRRHSVKCLTLQAIARPPRVATTGPGSSSAELIAATQASYQPRIGFTVTKKIGRAVERNRIRRRLKGALATSCGSLEVQGLLRENFDYVVVARRKAIDAPFENLIRDLTSAFAGVHRERSSAKGRRDASELQ